VNKKIKFLIIALLGAVFGLIMAEIGLRHFHTLRYGHQFYLWPPYLSRKVSLAQGVFPGVSKDKNFYINSLGMRGKEPTFKDEYRIVAVGGSTTESPELDESETWPYLLQEKLNGETHSVIWVGNTGRRGSTLHDNILHMYYVVSKLPNIDAIILLAGINDFMFGLSKDFQEFNPDSIKNPTINELDHAFLVHPYTKSGFKGTATWALIKQLKIIFLGRKVTAYNEGEAQTYWRQKRQNADNIDNSLPQLERPLRNYENNLNLFIDMAKTKSERVILLTQPSLWKENMSEFEQELLWFGCFEENGYICYSPQVLNDGLTKFNQKTLEVCQKRQVECLDLANKLTKDTTVFLDDVHYNENGSKEVTKVIFEYLISRAPFK